MDDKRIAIQRAMGITLKENMKQAIKFTLVVALAFLGIVFHGLKPKKRRELPEDHWI